MGIYILLTRLSPDALHQPKSFETLERHVAERVREHCPEVKWLANYALLGPWDYLDILEAPDNDTALRVALLVRSHGHASTELWPAVEWPHFKRLLQGFPVQA